MCIIVVSVSLLSDPRGTHAIYVETWVALMYFKNILMYLTHMVADVTVSKCHQWTALHPKVVFKRTLSCNIRPQHLMWSSLHRICLCACYKCTHFTQHMLVINVCVIDREATLQIQYSASFHPVVDGISLQQHLQCYCCLFGTHAIARCFIAKILQKYSCNMYWKHSLPGCTLRDKFMHCTLIMIVIMWYRDDVSVHCSCLVKKVLISASTN